MRYNCCWLLPALGVRRCGTSSSSVSYRAAHQTHQKTDKLQTCCLQEEEEEMRAHQPRPAPLKPQIYGLGVEQRVEALRQQNGPSSPRPRRGFSPLPTGMEECTFQPRTNFGGGLHRGGASGRAASPGWVLCVASVGCSAAPKTRHHKRILPRKGAVRCASRLCCAWPLGPLALGCPATDSSWHQPPF